MDRRRLLLALLGTVALLVGFAPAAGADAPNRSHVPQTDWQFSKTFEPITSYRA